MKVYDKQKDLKQEICNGCGKELLVEHGMLKDAVFEGKQTFGYFSNKDGQTHLFDLCEECYDKMTAGFRIPVTRKEETELL
jgi:hypothetical protein